MKANYDGLLAKLYRWYYVERMMPKSLCPYFWQCLFMFVTIIPVVIYSSLLIILSIFYNELAGDSLKDRLGNASVLNILIILVAIFFYTNITAFYVSMEHIEKYKTFYVIGGIITFIIICILIVVVFNLTKKYIGKLINKINHKNSNVETEKTPNIVVEFVKAKYNNYCPKIDWFGDDDFKTKNNFYSK